MKTMFTILLIFFLISSIKADYIIYLKNGKEMTVYDYKGKGNEICFDLHGGEMCFSKAEISKIIDANKKTEKIFNPEKEFSKNIHTTSNMYIREKIMLIKEKKYNDFENEINKLLQNINNNSELITDIYSFLINIPDILPYLNEWCNKSVDSHIAYTARGYFYIDYAWEARGKDFSKNVRKEAWPVFYERLELAQKDLEKAYRLNPKDPHPAAALITVARGLPKLDRNYMEEQFTRATNADPYNFAAHFNKMKYLLPRWHGKSPDEAFNFAFDAVKKAPSESNLVRLIIEIHNEKSLDLDDRSEYFKNPAVWNSIKTIYEELIKRKPDDMKLHCFYAKYSSLAEEIEVASREFKIAADRLPSNMSFYQYLLDTDEYIPDHYGKILYKEQKYKEAIDWFNEALKRDKKDAYASKMLAYCYSKLGDEKNAFKNVDESLSADTDQDKLKIWRTEKEGLSLYKNGEYQKAIAKFNDLLIKDSNSAYAYKMLAYSYGYLDDEQRIVENVTRSLAIDPDQKALKKWYDEKLGYLLYKKGKYTQAISSLNGAIERDANNPYFYELLAYCYIRLLNPKMAAENLRKSLSLDPDQNKLKKMLDDLIKNNKHLNLE